MALLLLLAPSRARADCPSRLADLAAGICQAQDFGQAETAMGELLQQLNAVLPAPGQAKLGQAQGKFLRRRTLSCTKSFSGAVFVDYACADRLTRARLAELQAEVSAPVPTPGDHGHYTVPGTAMPWLWTLNVLNSADAFGRRDGTGPIVLNLAALDAAPGQRLIIRYVSGGLSAGPAWPQADATGVASSYDNGGKGPGGALLPASYIRPLPVHLGALVGAFTDPAGVLAGAPFAPGDGPKLVSIPPGAAQLQLGINEDTAAGAAGSLVVSVVLAPQQKISGAGNFLHGCAIFGAGFGALCQDYPVWKAGLWLPPPGSGALHVVMVGGGGGGGLANLNTGVGGAGGGSGKVITANLPIPDGPILIVVGHGGTGARGGQPAGAGGTGSVFGGLLARGGWGGQPNGGGSAAGAGGDNGGGGGGGGTYQASFEAGAGGAGGSGGNPGEDGAPPNDLEAGWNGSAGGAGTAYPAFDLNDLAFGPGPGGAGGGFGSGGLTAAGANCAGGGGGGGGGGGVLINNVGPRAKAASGMALPRPCGAPAVSGQGGLGYGAGGGGAGAGLTGPAGSGANGVVYVEW